MSFSDQPQLEVRFFVAPVGRFPFWTGAEARHFLSGLVGDHPDTDLTLFHKWPDKSPMQHRAQIRWGGGKDCFRITAIGEGPVGILKEQVFHLITAIGSATGKAVPIETRSTRQRITPQIKWQVYTARSVVLYHRGDNPALFWGLPEERRLAVVKSRILGGIEHQMVTLRDVYAQDVEMPEGLDGVLEVTGLSLPYAVHLPGSTKATPKFADAVDVTLKLGCSLEGHWTVGEMTHLGMGKIFRQDAYHRPLERTTDLPEDHPNHPVRRRQLLGLKKGVACA